MFSNSFQVLGVSSTGAKVELHVVRVQSRLEPGPLLAVKTDPSRKLLIRGGRSMPKSNQAERDESLLIADAPEFDIETLVGEVLIPSTE